MGTVGFIPAEMSFKSLPKPVRTMAEAIRLEFVRDGAVESRVMVVLPDGHLRGLAVGPLIQFGGEVGRLVIEHAMVSAAAHGAEFVALGTEAMAAILPPGTSHDEARRLAAEHRLAEHPSAYEMLTIQAEAKAGAAYILEAKILRNPLGVELTNWEVRGGDIPSDRCYGEGRFCNIFRKARGEPVDD